MDTFHKYGIGVYGAFILGNDFESPAYYKKLAKFLVHSGIDIIQLSILDTASWHGLNGTT